MTAAESEHVEALKRAVQLLPACGEHDARQALLDESMHSLLLLARKAEVAGYLERGASYRRIVRAVAGMSALAIDVRLAAALYAALDASCRPGGDRDADALLAVAGV